VYAQRAPFERFQSIPPPISYPRSRARMFGASPATEMASQRFFMSQARLSCSSLIWNIPKCSIRPSTASRSLCRLRHVLDGLDIHT
jgi:hypothetical protein